MGRPKKKSNVGRPHAITPEVLAKLEQGFKIGLTDTECCCYADIDEATLYRYQKENPEFCEKKRKWKQNPIAKAKHTIYKNLDDAKTAQWYLERKCKEEFSTQSKVELQSQGLNIVVADDKLKQAIEEI